ncbi:hypothetical protein ACH5RR_027741 [Cinchona calisaya]|uniref:CCDC22 coiled-coil domain-containing protein n=1 Tax=Cinchona calisaya TaxID=153742 RepID=A0ABD2YLQ4_9GENT
MDDISFHKFLYPLEEDLYKLVRFLVGRLAKSSEVQKVNNQKETKEFVEEFKDLRMQSESAESANIGSGDSVLEESDKSTSILGSLSSDEDDGVEKSRSGTTDIGGPNASGNKETIALGFNEHFDKHEEKLNSLQDLSCEQKLLLDLIAKTSKCQHLQDEHELLKAAVAVENLHSLDFYIQQLNDLMEARRDELVKLESQWNALRRSIEEKRTSLEEAFCATKPDAHEKLQTKKDIEREIQSVSAEMDRREDQISELSEELEKQPKVALRGSFVLRIKEITKNSRKQDADIERILRETRELQLESNSIQERLNRTYAVVDETIFREARKDQVARQAYRSLRRIHECFEQTAEKVLLTDRTRREVVDYEAKLASMASRSLNIDKLQADLDAIRKENDVLERNLKDSTEH